MLSTLPIPTFAALPFWDIPPLEIGPLKFYPFGFLVGLAIIVGSTVANRRARRTGLDDQVTAELALWAVIPGMIGAHLYSALFYFPERILAEPLYILKIWDGISSFGGWLGGAAGVIYYLRRNRIPIWAYGDAVVYGLMFGFIFGRLGCTVAYDHPGILTDFALAMPYRGSGSVPAGLRHNIGFYEAVWFMVICAFLHFRGNRPRFSGWVVASVLLIYTPVRFVLDWFRVGDTEYLGLTPGQYAAIGLFITGCLLYRWRGSVGEVVTVDGEVHVFGDGSSALRQEPAGAASKRKRK